MREKTPLQSMTPVPDEPFLTYLTLALTVHGRRRLEQMAAAGGKGISDWAGRLLDIPEESLRDFCQWN